MKNVHKRKGSGPRKAKHMVSIAITLMVSLSIMGCPPYKWEHDYKDTNGRARGVAVQGSYAYVADGDRGLKIFNIDNPDSVHGVGPGLDLNGFNEHVAVQGDIAVLSDTEKNRIYIVKIFDKFAPQLVWTYDTLDKPRAVFLNDGIAYVAERGNDPQHSSYFSGLEVISCSLSNPPARLSSIAIDDISDVMFSSFSGKIYAVSKNELFIMSQTQSGSITTITTYPFSGSESIQSIDHFKVYTPASFGFREYLLILGNNLYVMDLLHPSAPSLVDSKPVPGYEHNRVISTSGNILFSWGQNTIFRTERVFFCYSTRREVGWGEISMRTKKIARLQEIIDLDRETEGHVKVYDIKFILTGKTVREGDPRGDERKVGLVGAVDKYGLGFAVYEEITYAKYEALKSDPDYIVLY